MSFFLRELESQVVSNPLARRRLTLVSFLAVHDLALLPAGNANHTPYVEAHILPAGVLCPFFERAGESGGFNYADDGEENEAHLLQFFFSPQQHLAHAAR